MGNTCTDTYTVEGRWPFPADMLHFDGSRPATAVDRALIHKMTGATEPEGVDLVQITLSGPEHLVSVERWASFGWTVIQTDGKSVSQGHDAKTGRTMLSGGPPLSDVVRYLTVARANLAAFSGTTQFTRTRHETETVMLSATIGIIRPLVYTFDTIAERLDVPDRLEEVDYRTSPISTLDRISGDIALVESWVRDPFLHDMRDGYREAAIVNLHKALDLLAGMVDVLGQKRPSRRTVRRGLSALG